MKEAKPRNSLFFPLRSEMPTVTTVRIKGFLGGVLSTVFEFTENLVSSVFTEDNVLHQLKSKRGPNAKVVFYGDYIWTPMFGHYFDRYEDYHSLNVRDLDTLDSNVQKHIIDELKEGSNFDLLLGHLIGVDSAGHTFHAKHSEIERKLLDTEAFLAKVIDLMDDETTLVVFGDHGMTSDGNHGGQSDLEMRTVLFAYQKQPFAMGSRLAQNAELFGEMDRNVKQVDLAPTLSVLLDLPFPYSNVGVFHPAFAPSANLRSLYTLYMKNMEQVQQYLQAYCQATNQYWCAEETRSFKAAVEEF